MGVASSGFLPSSILLHVLGQGHFTPLCLSYAKWQSRNNVMKQRSGPPVFMRHFICRKRAVFTQPSFMSELSRGAIW